MSPMSVIAPNLRTRATMSMNTGPASTAAMAGSRMLPATPNTAILANAATPTSAK